MDKPEILGQRAALAARSKEHSRSFPMPAPLGAVPQHYSIKYWLQEKHDPTSQVWFSVKMASSAILLID